MSETLGHTQHPNLVVMRGDFSVVKVLESPKSKTSHYFSNMIERVLIRGPVEAFLESDVM